MNPPTTHPSYTDQMNHIRSNAAMLSHALPDVMKGFYALSKAATSPGALDAKTKELIALAIAVATHCDDCIPFHTTAALQAGASRSEILDMLAVTISMGGGPALMFASHVLDALHELQPHTPDT
ncbi:MAG TPA: carboxymuconolactone decarboxylase family protein [Coleofasciculaceae cyanobacterium]